MSFWNQAGANPKRKFRFKIGIAHADWQGGSTIWYAKTCTAPSVEVSSVEHMFSDHVFNFPGRAKWGDVTMMLVDPAGGGAGAATADPNTVKNFNELLEAFGYNIPTDGTSQSNYNTISRNKITDAVVTITAIDDNGDALETWELYNAFPIAFKYGDFDYGTDDLREFEITWKYDWAKCSVLEGGSVSNTYFST